MKFNTEQLKGLSEFTSNLGLIFFATVVTPIFSDPGKMNIPMVTLGLILMGGCLYVSMYLIKGAK